MGPSQGHMARLKKSSIEERKILQEQIIESSDNLYRMINKKTHSFYMIRRTVIRVIITSCELKLQGFYNYNQFVRIQL